MTEFQMLLRAIEVRGEQVAHAATRRAGDALSAAAAELAGVAVSRDGDDVVLDGAGLHARAFGSRRALPDPRFVGLVR